MNGENSIIADLDFRPDWARRPAGLKVHSGTEKKLRGKERAQDEHRPEREKRQGKGGARLKKTLPRTGRRYEIAAKTEPPRARAGSHPPVRVFFIPERNGLKPVAELLAGTRKAHSLLSVASMFLSKPEYFAVKLESAQPGEGEGRALLYQCSICKIVQLGKQEIIAHILNKHLDVFYKSEEVAVDPPKGEFPCVAQCRLSGELLGPPNYHGYNERVMDVLKNRFPGMSLEEYRRHIVNNTEKTLIEQWREGMSRQTKYSTLKATEPKVFLRRSEVEAHFVQHHVPSAMRVRARFIIPGIIGLSDEGGMLGRIIRECWERECRFPAKMGIALYPAFRHQGLHMFRAKDGSLFVTAIRPNPVVPAQTADRMKTILEFLALQPRCGRMELVKHLCPGAAAESPEAAEIVSRLCWLIDRGHVIEFADGKLVAAFCEKNVEK